ncbi:LAME_0A03598g1_1 [Lachancea meyersii CBS 8951]|uniref:LAME_0A03598g1_1 n=1 Tax=Lachancea meyersii CBS 8951 TaxID=1266667 RepID=A0A1G4INI3_9SACH|nr:LAME_0A03598g1_1 [Lachancea meyersii CBS 8951]
MKLLRDLKVLRKDLQDWTDNLAWGPDGMLYITTVPDLTVCQPLYNESITNNSKDLFHVKEYPLILKNKFEFLLAQENTILNSIPDSFVKCCKVSPVTNLVAVLTNNGNACVYKDARLLFELDEAHRELKERSYHSLAWSPCGTLINVGNECGEVITFRIVIEAGDYSCERSSSTSLVEDSTSWITKLKWSGQQCLAALSDNSVFLIKGDATHVQIIEPSRFCVFDFCGIRENIIVTRMGSIFRYDMEREKLAKLDWSGHEALHIVPLPSRNAALLLSSKTSCLLDLDQGMQLLEDKLVAPHLETRFKKWNSYFNELNNYETGLSIHGLSTSKDGASLALLYSIDRLSLRYRIVSEQAYRVCFLPLSNMWQIKPQTTGLAWFQTYQIYGKQLPPNSCTDVHSLHLDTGVNFRIYLQMLMSNESMNAIQFSSFVNEEKDNLLYKKAVYDYAAAHKDEITNDLDRASVQAIAQMLALESLVTPAQFSMKSEFIEETFAPGNDLDMDAVRSKDGHVWRRCAATFLPLLTPQVKTCPVSKYQIIDVKRDSLNNFGWLTRTILEFFNNQSIYSGTNML